MLRSMVRLKQEYNLLTVEYSCDLVSHEYDPFDLCSRLAAKLAMMRSSVIQKVVSCLVNVPNVFYKSSLTVVCI